MIITNDIKEKILSIPVEKVAQSLGIIVRNGHKAFCPFHDDKNHPSFSFNVKNNYCHCFTCGEGGNTINLAEKMLNVDFKEACLWLADRFGIYIPDNNSYRYKPIKKIRTNIHHDNTNHDKTTTHLDVEVMTWIVENAGLSTEAKDFLFDERKYKKEIVERLHIGSISNSEKFVKAIVERFGLQRALESQVIKQTKFGLSPFCNTPCLLFPTC